MTFPSRFDTDHHREEACSSSFAHYQLLPPADQPQAAHPGASSSTTLQRSCCAGEKAPVLTFGSFRDAVEILFAADEKFLSGQGHGSVGFVVELVGGEGFEFGTFFQND